MKKIFFLLFSLISITSQAQVNVVGYIQTNGVANYPTHIDSMGKGGYIVARDTIERDAIPCLRRKYGMAVYVQSNNKLYILKDSTCSNVWVEFTSGGGGGVTRIIAGSNITISPTGGTGEVTINSTGGGGGSQGFGSFKSMQEQHAILGSNKITIPRVDTANKFSVFEDATIINEDSGLFNFQITIQFEVTDGKADDASIWIRKNGVNIEETRKKVDLKDNYTFVTFNNILKLNKADSIQYYWNTSDTQYVRIKPLTTEVSGTSVRLTITPVLGGGSGSGGNSNIINGCDSSANKQFYLPNKSGYLMNANLPIIISAGDSSEAYLDHPDNYEVIRLNSDAQTMLLHFPDAKNACLSGGQRMVITNKVDDPSKTGVIQLAAAEGQDILYRGTQIAVEQIGTGETVEFLADVDDRGDGFWRTITSLPEPAVTLNMADLGNHYYIHSNGTYLITHATDGYNIFFPAPCYMQGSKITLINIDGTYNQPIRALAPGDCGGAVIVDVAGNEIDNQTVTSTSTYVAVGDKWYRIAYEDL